MPKNEKLLHMKSRSVKNYSIHFMYFLSNALKFNCNCIIKKFIFMVMLTSD